MQPWFAVVRPHEEIRKGKPLDESVFAADLSDVAAGRGPLEYVDAEMFFRKTFPTRGLRNLLVSMLRRLSGQGEGEPIVQIQTPFGGGKTHALIALYHLFRHGSELKHVDSVREILETAGVPDIPSVRVVTFVGTAADVLHGRTPLGEIAHQLGHYDDVRDYDEQRKPPGKNKLHELLGNAPTLILMDEIVEYGVKAKEFMDQIVAFFQELTEAVKVLPQCALVATLPSSAPYGEEGERVLHQLQQIFGRMETIYTPVEGEEIYAVIRRRLFEDLGNTQIVRRVANVYGEMYRQLGEDVPREFREPAYRDRIVKAYPFHPEVIDILFERWSTFPTFQRTRGVLRLLGEIVADLYRRQVPTPLIQPAHIHLGNERIRREFIKHIGNEYEGVIASDISGPDAKAPRIDREMGGEYTRFAVAEGLATSIFFYSFSGGEKRGVSAQRLRVAVIREGIPSALVGDALHRLEDVLWYLHVDKGIYVFSSQPNLNRILVEREETIQPEDVQEEIRHQVNRIAGQEIQTVLWPKTSQDIRDTRRLKLAVLSPKYAYTGHSRRDQEVESFVQVCLTQCGENFRTFLNTLLILVPDSGGLFSLQYQIKRMLALQSIRDDTALVRSLSDENRRWLQDRLKKTEQEIPFLVLSAYRHLARWGANQHVEWFDLGIPTVGEKMTLSQRVLEYLREMDILADRLSPSVIVKKAFGHGEEEKRLHEVVDAFFRYPNMPVVADVRVIQRAVEKGVQEGLLGIRVQDRWIVREPLTADVWDDEDAILVFNPSPPSPPAEVSIDPRDVVNMIGDRGEVPVREIYRHLWAKKRTVFPDENGFRKALERAVQEAQEKGWIEVVVSEGAEYLSGTIKKKETPHPLVQPPRTGKEFHLHVRLPWDRFSDFFRGVIMPLRNAGADLEVEILIRAQSTREIPSETHQTIDETLSQIDALVVKKFD